MGTHRRSKPLMGLKLNLSVDIIYIKVSITCENKKEKNMKRFQLWFWQNNSNLFCCSASSSGSSLAVFRLEPELQVPLSLLLVLFDMCAVRASFEGSLHMFLTFYMDILWPSSSGSAVLIHPPCCGRLQKAQRYSGRVVTVTHTAVAHGTSASVSQRGQRCCTKVQQEQWWGRGW